LENPIFLNGRPASNHATLEEVGLSYPLTAADLVDNWENVNALLQTFSSGARGFIRSAAPFGGPADE